jgi:hypothetical protein
LKNIESQQREREATFETELSEATKTSETWRLLAASPD